MKPIIFGTILMSMLFARPFVGIEILGFRLGEFITFVGLIFAMIFLFTPKKLAESIFFNKYFFYSLKLIIISFFIINFVNQGSFLNTYTYKSSSYIWTTSLIILGLITRADSFVKNNYFFNFCAFFYLFVFIR